MHYIRLLLLPFSLLYGIAVWTRNRCYDRGWFKSTHFDIPVIVVGNLAVGGTGKSPMTEYLIRLLKSRMRVATLSRGYGRKTSGYLEVTASTTADECGDEPLQFSCKFPDITVAVCEDRVAGVRRLEVEHDVILLDDAFQHRALKPGLSILLFDYRSVGKPKLLLPAGNFRDFFSERRRADIIVVTKTPANTTSKHKSHIREQLKLRDKPDLPVLFAGITYGALQRLQGNAVPDSAKVTSQTNVLLVTGIANPKPLFDYIQPKVGRVVPMAFPDHHRYTTRDLDRIRKKFHALPGADKLIITTEKDAQRLASPDLQQYIADLPIAYTPIHMVFDEDDAEIFASRVLHYCHQQPTA